MKKYLGKSLALLLCLGLLAGCSGTADVLPPESASPSGAPVSAVPSPSPSAAPEQPTPTAAVPSSTPSGLPTTPAVSPSAPPESAAPTPSPIVPTPAPTPSAAPSPSAPPAATSPVLNADGEIGGRTGEELGGGSGGLFSSLFGGSKSAAAESGGSVSLDAAYAPMEAPMDAPAMPGGMEVMPEPMPGIEPVYPPEQEIDPAAGTLTAGSIDDNRAWSDFTDNAGQVWNDLMSTWSLRPTHRVEVVLTDAGQPIPNLSVALLAGDEVLWQAVTDYEGRAFLFYGLTGAALAPDAVRVYTTPEGETFPLEADQQLLELDLPDIVDALPAPVDVMFMVDTTGSMGDELEYLKAELEDVLERAGQTLGNRQLRLSVNFYRDEGDEYVVRYFRFHEDISQAIENLRAQSADGGGDYPEAVDQALDNAVNGHAWEEGAVKLLFLVLDAPAHQSDEIAESLRASITEAAAQGIRIIPVASSGVDEETEFLTRSAAVLTGGQYTFLTDHSGVGLSHKDPTNVDYQVEPLNDLLLRLITLYAGA